MYLANEECDEEGWAVCVNAQGQKGYVPCNYLELEENNGEVAEASEAAEAAPEAQYTQPQYVEEEKEIPWPTSWPGMEPTPQPPTQPSQPPPVGESSVLIECT